MHIIAFTTARISLHLTYFEVKLRVMLGDGCLLHYGVPQGSIPGALLFTLYIAPLQDVIATFNLQCMFYADDSHLYIAVKPSTPELAIDSLSICIKAVFGWNTCNKLQTNRGKTEVLRLTSRFVKNPSLGPQFVVAGVPVNITSQTH